MAKHIQQTRVMLGDLDLSSVVANAVLRRWPGEADTVELTVFVKRLEVVDGTLVVHLEQPEG